MSENLVTQGLGQILRLQLMLKTRHNLRGERALIDLSNVSKKFPPVNIHSLLTHCSKKNSQILLHKKNSTSQDSVICKIRNFEKKNTGTGISKKCPISIKFAECSSSYQVLLNVHNCSALKVYVEIRQISR